MQIYKSPQYNVAAQFKYEFSGDMITATLLMSDGVLSSDIFDFTDFPDGELEVDTIESMISIQPILSAKRIDGELFVEVLNYIDSEATEEELYPEWTVV